MSDYRDSLNLPHTDFPMKANLPAREPEHIKRWSDEKIYSKMRDTRAGAPLFILHDGPPYANARPHLGTAMNKILKDVVLKSKSLSGFNAPYVPGWDCHGLPIELNVEKKKGKPGHKITKEAFREACADYAHQQVNLQREDFKRLGVMADWDRPYLTLQSSYEADVVRGLIPMIKNKHLKPGKKPVYWCPICASALAEAEVEYQDKTSPAIDVAFDAYDMDQVAAVFGVPLNRCKRLTFPIWTTTPWTLPANEAVAVHPELSYVWVDSGERVFVLAKALVAAVMLRYGFEEYKEVATVKGASLEKLLLKHPLMDKAVPIILGEHVAEDAGTGHVHTAPAHGVDDYHAASAYNLPVISPVLANSCFADNVPHVANMHVYKANEPIIDILQAGGHLLAHESIEHSYPHCWRHKSPLVFRATPQYFIDMQQSTLRNDAQHAVDNIQWLPTWGSKRMGSMLKSRPDWCISRQRAWGTPLPLLVHKQTQELHPDTEELLKRIADLIEREGSQAWFATSVADWLDKDADSYEKVNDTLDVWFDSGMSHHAVLDRRDGLKVPADLYFEGSDQHRGWFQTSLLTSLAMRGRAPYKQVITHGYVVDAAGKKMSKSIGNVIAPSEVVERYGADVLRLWAASALYQDDIHFSDEILKRNADAYRRLRNTARFLLSNLFDFDPTSDAVEMSEMLALDQWVVDQACALQEKIIQAYDTYQFHIASHSLHQFCIVTLGNFYLDVVKDRLYTCHPQSLARRSAQSAIWHLLEALVRWMMPILPFTAEELWSFMPGNRENSVLLEKWYPDLVPLPGNSPLNQQDWMRVQKLREVVNKLLEQHRKSQHIGSGLDARVVIYANEDWCQLLSVLQDELRFIFICSQTEVLPLGDWSGKEEALSDIEGVRLTIEVLDAEKCVRCWQRREDVGQQAEHPELCGRCSENLISGEERVFA